MIVVPTATASRTGYGLILLVTVRDVDELVAPSLLALTLVITSCGTSLRFWQSRVAHSSVLLLRYVVLLFVTLKQFKRKFAVSFVRYLR